MSQQPSTLASTHAQTWAIIVWAMFLASILSVAFTAIIGLIIAYVKRRDLAGTPYASHMTSAIRTFWITLIVGLIGFVLMVVGIGYLILGLLALWHLFRVIRGLIYAIDGRPIADPAGWL
jgi:uncharacterized membrane protein